MEIKVGGFASSRSDNKKLEYVKHSVGSKRRSNRGIKRNKSAVDIHVLTAESSPSNRFNSPKHFYSIDLDIDKPRPEVGQAPAHELDDVWEHFIEEGWNRQRIPSLIRELHEWPIFERMTVLVLERQGIEKIFEYLRPCVSLIALYLKGNRVITRDLVQIQHLVNLRKVDLSSNEIHFLPDFEKLAKLKKLEYLQLHKNLLVGWRQLENLTCLKLLRHMTMQGNPCAKIKGYRKFLVDNLPQLRSLDEFIVMDFERTDIAAMFPPENIKRHKLAELHRFRPFNKETTSWRSSRYELLNPIEPECASPASPKTPKRKSIVKREKPQFSSTIMTENYQMTSLKAGIEKHLAMQTYALRRKFEWCSPILTIQKTAKMKIYRRKYLRKQRMTKILVWALNRWNKRGHIEYLLKCMKLDRELLFQIGRIRFVQHKFRELKAGWDLSEKIAKRGQTIFRMKKVQDQTIDHALDLDPRSQEKTYRKLLFRKTQLNLISRIGLIQFAVDIKDSQRFSIRRAIKVDPVQIRKSPLMNLIICSYRVARVLRANSIFKMITDAVQQSKTQLTVLKTHEGTLKTESSQEGTSVDYLPSSQMKAVFKPSLEPAKANHNKNSRVSIESILEKPMIDDETALVEVTFDSDFEISQSLKAMASYNRRNATVIEVFYEPFMRRFEAAFILQRWMKGVLFRRRTKPIFVQRADKSQVLGDSITGRPITLDNTLYTHYVLIQRVARRIQRFFRTWCLRQRVNSLIKIADYVSQIDSPKIYLEQTMYLHLREIFRNATSSPWHKAEAKVEKNEPSNRKDKNRKVVLKKNLPLQYHDMQQGLFERRFRYQVSVKDNNVKIAYTNRVDKTGRYSESNLPLWFQRKTNTEIPKIVAKKAPRFPNNILSLIHMQPNPLNNGLTKGAPKVVNLSELDHEVYLERDMVNTKLVKLSLPSIEEAKNRAIVLALLTCNYRISSSSFVRFFTKTDFIGKRKAPYTYHLIRKMHLEQKIEDTEAHLYLAPAHVTMAQPHNGLIRKREEPFTTLLRARPREKKTHFERFIVLGDADPRHVEERLGNALISNEVISKLKTVEPEIEGLVQPNLGKEEYQYAASRNSLNNKKPANHVTLKGRSSQRVGIAQNLTIQDSAPDGNAVKKAVGQKRNLTPGEIAIQKQKLQQSRDKIYKLETVQKKLLNIKKLIDQSTSKDQKFKSTFIQQLFPMLKTQQKELSEPSKEVEVTEPLERKKTMVIDMPRTDVDYLDPGVEVLTNDKIDSQIDTLYQIYLKQKMAYRATVNIMNFDNRHNNPSTPRRKFEQKKIEKISKSFNAKRTKISSTPGGAQTPTAPKVVPAQVSKSGAGDTTLVLTRFNQQMSEEKGTPENKLVHSRSSTNVLRSNNLLQKSTRLAQINKDKNEEKNNSLMTAPHQQSQRSLRDYEIRKKKSNNNMIALRLAQVARSSIIKRNSAAIPPELTHDSLIIDGITRTIDPNRTGGASAFRKAAIIASVQDIPLSPIRRQHALKDQSHRRDSNIQRLQITARHIESNSNMAKQLVMIKSRDSEEDEHEHRVVHSKSQLFEPIAKVNTSMEISEAYGQKIDSMYKLHQDNVVKQELPALNFQIPKLSYRKRSTAMTQRNDHETKSTVDREGNVKVESVLADLDDMRRAREIASLQNQQSTQGAVQYMKTDRQIKSKVTRNLEVLKNGIKTEPLVLQNKPMPKKTKMQVMLEKKIKKMAMENFTDKQNHKSPKKQSVLLHSSSVSQIRNQQQLSSTIETIMRNRKRQNDTKEQILQYSGVNQVKEYLDVDPDDLDGGQSASYLNMDQLNNVSAVAGVPFSYQVQDSVSPKLSMVGVSRTRSVNKFTSGQSRKRVLSIFPSLTKKSVGKFTPLQ